MTNDIDELTALNRDFVASVQNSDVRRFDEILAPEFYCSNLDKSLVDRAAFLEQTAKPVAIKNLRAHDVKIRIMGDFAIIHAATSYTTPDGQQAHGRGDDGQRVPQLNDDVVQVHASGFTSGELTWPSTWTDRLDRDRTPSIPGTSWPEWSPPSAMARRG